MKMQLKAVLHGYEESPVHWTVDMTPRGTYARLAADSRVDMLISEQAIYDTFLERGVDAARAAAVERIESLRLDWSWLNDPDGVPDLDDDGEID